MIDSMITDNFSYNEFRCPCCELSVPSLVLCRELETLRKLINRPVYITSGTRCGLYNKLVGGVRNSYHLPKKFEGITDFSESWAADIIVPHLAPSVVASIARLIFDGVGLYDTHTHVDIRLDKKKKAYFNKSSGLKTIQEVWPSGKDRWDKLPASERYRVGRFL